jgi:hypothetical protein
MNAATALKENVVMDLVEACMAANIPLEKLDNPKLRKFIQTSVKGGGHIPQAPQLRKEYVPKVFAKTHAKVWESLQEKRLLSSLTK